MLVQNSYSAGETGLRQVTQQEGTVQLFAAAKCHVTPSWVKRFMKQYIIIQ